MTTAKWETYKTNIRRKKVGNGYHYKVTIRKQDYPTVCEIRHTLTDAEKFRSEVLAKMAAGDWNKNSKANDTTLSDAFDWYLKNVSSHAKSPERLARDKRCAKQLKQKLGKLTFNTLSVKAIRDYRDYRLSSVVPRSKPPSPVKWDTVRIELAFLSSVITKMKSERDVQIENYAQKVKKPDNLKDEQQRREAVVFPDDKIEPLLEACKKRKNAFLYPIVCLAYATGMRKSQILRIKKEDFSPDDSLLSVPASAPNKSNFHRWVYLTKRAVEALKMALEVRPSPDDTDLIFWGEKRNGKRSIHDFKEGWNEVRRELGLEKYRFHDWRHTASTRLAANGIKIEQRMQQIGHSTAQQQLQYTHLEKPKHMIEQLRSLEEQGLLR